MDRADASRKRNLIAYLPPLVLFGASRLVVILAMRFAASHLPTNTEASTWDATDSWYRYLLRYDSGWYLRIAKEGYSYNGNNVVEQTVAFYPLYPATIRTLKYFGFSEAAAAVLIPNVAIIAAVILFYKLVRDLYDTQTALLSVALISFFPTSLFFSAGYTESFAFLFIVCFFRCMVRGRFLLAALFAGLCFATRSTGIALIAPLAWEVTRRYWSTDRKRLIWEGAACLIIATSGLWLYMIYLWVAFRAPFSFMTAQAAWNSGRDFGNPLLLVPFTTLTDIAHGGITPNALAPWLTILFAAMLVVFRKQLSAPMLLFAAVAILLPYLTLSGSRGFMSLPRYLLVVFPVFVVVARFCAERTWLAVAISTLSAAMLFWYTALFSKWYWVG